MACALGLTACNGSDASGDGDGDAHDNGGTPTVESLRAELGLGDATVSLHDGMEEMEDLFYEEAWTAMDDGRLTDTARALVHVHHLLTHAEVEDEHKDDARFAKMLGDAATDALAIAELALAGDAEKLRPAMADLDKRRCIACHKIYRKDD